MGGSSVTLFAKWTPVYTIGGSITGLTATGLVLRNNGGNDLTVASGANSFTFTTALVTGTNYAVTVQTQPTGLECTVSNGTGAVAIANVTNVTVGCIVPVVGTRTFTPAAGHYNTAQNITISTTTDGATPTSNSTLYSTAVHIWSLAGKTVKALATKSGMTDSAILSGVFSYPPLKTGQTLCYDSTGTTGNTAACTGTKQDGESQNGVTRSYTGPTQHGTYTSDYTTTDNATGLVWKTCTQGLSGATCATGTAITMNWTDAASGANGCNTLNSANSGNGYAGIKAWRLPTRQELETLPEYGKATSPLIDTTAFPATVAASYWSSTTNALNTGNAWHVNFDHGRVLSINKTTVYYVRCVSGTSKEYSSNFTDNSNGTVKDNATGLIWQKCSRGQNNDATCTGTATTATWANAITYCSGLNNLPSHP